MIIKVSDVQCQAFIQGVFGGQRISPNALLCLGHGPAYADPCVIEIALRDTPLRFSFKFRQNDPLGCCVNLRPFATVLGQAGDQEQRAAFRDWIAAHYSSGPRAADAAPYFKPYGHPPATVNGNTVDTYFDVAGTNGSDLCLDQPSTVMACPEFPHLAKQVTLQLTLAQAVQRILLRAQIVEPGSIAY